MKTLLTSTNAVDTQMVDQVQMVILGILLLLAAVWFFRACWHNLHKDKDQRKD